MRKLVIILGAMVSGSGVYAQLPDTAAGTLAADSAAFAVYRWAQLSPAFIQQAMPAAYNQAVLGYQKAGGTFMAAQEASGISRYTAATEGKTALGSVHLWGSFSYEKTTEDSTRFAHQTRNNTSTPYYYGSPGNVSYHRSVYQARALVSKSFFRQRMPAGIGIDYRIGSHFSANDPRGSITDFALSLTGSLGYTFGQRFTVAAQGYYGYGQEMISVGYKNEQYQQSTVYPQYVNYMINGYGEPEYQFSNLRYRNMLKHTGGGISLQYRLPTGLLAFQGKRISENQRFRYQSGDGFLWLSCYDIVTTQFNLLWHTRWGAKGLTLALQGQQQQGKDFHLKYQANNYRYNAWAYTGMLAYTVHQKSLTYNYGLRVQTTKEQRIDGIYGNNLRYNRAAISPGFGMQIRTAGKNTWGFDINGAYEKALNYQAVVSSINVSYFTQQVIYHDFYYQTANAAGGNLSLHLSRAFDGFNAGIKLSGSYRRALEWNALQWPQALYPGKDRYSINAGVYFFF